MLRKVLLIPVPLKELNIKPVVKADNATSTHISEAKPVFACSKAIPCASPKDIPVSSIKCCKDI